MGLPLLTPRNVTRRLQLHKTDAMARQDERELREQLTRLRAEHRDLDSEIVVMEQTGSADQLLVKRLKRRKLVLKDQITSIEDRLLPDIIA
jgi:hypothetical protein